MYRIGFGNDIHRLAANLPLVFGGVRIPSEKGAVGHSDADALYHAVTDALLGALALGDIGEYFSDLDDQWKDAVSRVFLSEAVRMTKQSGFEVVNLDSVITIEQPKLRPFIDKMRENVSRLLDIDTGQVSVKAKTNEKLGDIGEGNAVRAEAVVLILKTRSTRFEP